MGRTLKKESFMNGDGDKKVRTFIASFSDLHFGEKEFRDDGTRNPITDFYFDREFVDLLGQLKMRAEKAQRKCLVLNGDILDTQIVAMLGEYNDYPLESVAVYKIKEIIGAHPEIFDCLKDLIDNGWEIFFIIGNHDVAVSWDAVQGVLSERLAFDHPKRLIFADDCEIDGLHFRHGYEVEPHNTVASPLERFRSGFLVKIGGKNIGIWIPESLGPEIQKKKKKKNAVLEPCTILNAPVGNYMVTEWSNHLRQVGDPNVDGPHRWIGRIYTHGAIWRHSFLHDLKFGTRAGFVWARGWITLLFGSLFDVRKKVSWFQLFWQLLSASIFYTNRDMSVAQTKIGFEILKKNPHLRAVVMGHTHKAGRWTSEVGSVYNTGTWIIKYELPEPPHGRWKRFKHWFKPVKPILTPWLTFFIAEVYEDNEVDAGIYEYDPENLNYKEVI